MQSHFYSQKRNQKANVPQCIQDFTSYRLKKYRASLPKLTEQCYRKKKQQQQGHTVVRSCTVTMAATEVKWHKGGASIT